MLLCVHIRAAGEMVECCSQIAYRAVLPKTALELASFRRMGRDFAFVKIHRKRDVPIRRELLSLFLHPFVQTPPFMNDNYRSMAPRITRQGQKSQQLSRWRARMPPSGVFGLPGLTRSGR